MVSSWRKTGTEILAEQHHLHLISDSTGETLHAISRASLAPFSQSNPHINVSIFVRTESDLQIGLQQVRENPGLVFYTLADTQLRQLLLKSCEDMGVIAIAPLDPVVEAMSAFLGKPPEDKPGMQHRITSDYFDRIAALDYAVSHDDGALGDRLLNADVILTGVSRTSKTPTCIYLAYRGIKAANVPLVPKTEPSRAFFDAIKRGVPVIGLTASPSRLSQVRTHRLDSIGSTKTAEYAELDQIRGEVANARLFFDRHEIPVIDVTRRSIEETAAEVLAHLRAKGVARA